MKTINKYGVKGMAFAIVSAFVCLAPAAQAVTITIPANINLPPGVPHKINLTPENLKALDQAVGSLPEAQRAALVAVIAANLPPGTVIDPSLLAAYPNLKNLAGEVVSAEQ